jgi:predicted Zn-dependent peptidase
MFYGEQSIYAKEIQDPKQVLDKVEAVNLDQIKTVIDRIIKPELINLSIVGPYKDPSKFEKLINSKE